MDDWDYRKFYQLAEVAEMYFIKKMQQAEIAVKLNVSRSLVSRMISEAQERGVVSISINHFFKRSEELENELCSRFGIETAGVLVLPGEMPDEDIRKQLGRLTADLVYEELSEGSILGITFGTSLKDAVAALSYKSPKYISCVQLAGSMGAAESAFDAHELVHLLSSAWSCGSVFLHAPLMVNSEEIRRHLFENRSNSLNAEMCRKMNVAIVGLSSYDIKSRPALFTGGHVTAEELAGMRNHGIIGDVGTFSINAEGHFVDVKSMTKMIGLDEKGWKKVDSRYGLAFGEAKVNIIRAALSGGWLNRFVTDEQTAKLILGNGSL